MKNVHHKDVRLFALTMHISVKYMLKPYEKEGKGEG